MGLKASVIGKIEFDFGSGLDLALNSERPTLIPAFAGKDTIKYGVPTTFIVATPSSGEESEDEIPVTYLDTSKMTS